MVTLVVGSRILLSVVCRPSICIARRQLASTGVDTMGNLYLFVTTGEKTSLLTIVDKYQCPIQTKGGNAQFSSKVFIITCPHDIDETFANRSWTVGENIGQIKRRFTEVHFLGAPTDEHPEYPPLMKSLNEIPGLEHIVFPTQEQDDLDDAAHEKAQNNDSDEDELCEVAPPEVVEVITVTDDAPLVVEEAAVTVTEEAAVTVTDDVPVVVEEAVTITVDAPVVIITEAAE
jgi:hypothetical protein